MERSWIYHTASLKAEPSASVMMAAHVTAGLVCTVAPVWPMLSMSTSASALKDMRVSHLTNLYLCLYLILELILIVVVLDIGKKMGSPIPIFNVERKSLKIFFHKFVV